MDTLEQRVAWLERSGRFWRLACLALGAMLLSGAAAGPAAPPDAQFGHLTVRQLTIHDQVGGAFISAHCDADRASITLASPQAQTMVALIAQKDSANLLISRKTEKGMASATVMADDQSALINLQGLDNKSKEIEPE
jgi:hypothetical protein